MNVFLIMSRVQREMRLLIKRRKREIVREVSK